MIEQAFKQLEKMKDFVLFHDVDLDINFEIIEKSLEALEIIKEKRVDLSVLIESKSLREYTDRICARVNFGRLSEQNLTYLKLTQEEYDLLKEVLAYGSED